MKKIAIYCVTYNSYDCLGAFFQSIDKAAEKLKDVAKVEVFVADNTENDVRKIHADLRHASLQVFPYHKNLGYFGGIRKLMLDANPSGYDFVIISNVDLVLEEGTLLRLSESYGSASNSIGWIAPRIYSEVEGRDRNPKIMHRYSLRKLRMLRCMFSFPILYSLYRGTAYKRKKFQSHEKGEIYGGHGSFIILTREYIDRCGIIDYPVFLFGEEIYLAEQCHKQGLKVVYDPCIEVTDKEHASTGQMPSRFYCRCNAEALGYIMRTFY